MYMLQKLFLLKISSICAIVAVPGITIGLGVIISLTFTLPLSSFDGFF